MNLFGVRIFEKKSGSHVWANAISDDPDLLDNAARYLKTEVKTDGRGRHLDLTPQKVKQALAKGAQVTTEKWY